MSGVTTLPPLFTTQINSDTSQRFPGLQGCFRGFSNQSFLFADEVVDDLEGERETFALPSESDAANGVIEGEKFLDAYDENGMVVDEPDIAVAAGSNGAPPKNMDATGLRSIVMHASKGVTEGTDQDYRR